MAQAGTYYSTQASQANRWPSSSTALLGRVREQLERLTELPYDWDSYGGVPVDASLAEAARRFVAAVIQLGVAPPLILPTPSGGIAMEWHRQSRELIIEAVLSRRRFEAYFCDEETGQEWAMEAPDDGRLLPALAQMEG